jgi:Uma2 family endonuclease
MIPGAVPGKLTYDDYLSFPDDGLRHELIDGVDYVTPSPGRSHQRVLLNLAWAIETFLERHPLGELFIAPFDVVLTRHDVVEPDVLFIRNERLDILTEANVIAAPDLAVEILSPATRRRDRTVKLALYERTGVQEYWIADPVKRVVAVYRRSGETLACAGEFAGSDVLTTPLLAGFSLTLDRLFRRA